MIKVLAAEGLSSFYQNLSSFPTVIFSFFLLISLLYWLVAMLGLVDLDFLDLEAPELDSSLEGQGSQGGIDSVSGLLLRLGLNGVPVTIIVSLVSLIGWVLCYYAAHFLFAIVPFRWLELLLGIPLLLACLYVAVLITAQVIKPLRPLFRDALAEGKTFVIGQTAVVRTSRVDAHFGEALLEDGGAGLILKVRSSDGETFRQGDRVVLLDYDANTGTYRIVSEREFNHG